MRPYDERDPVNTPRNLNENDPQVPARAAAVYGNAQYEAFISSLRGRAEIDVRTKNLERK